jgi:hypothetical protein
MPGKRKLPPSFAKNAQKVKARAKAKKARK